jgi:methionine-S-sulfoxide reductase
MQDLFRKRPGVLSTRVGYTGGDVPNATYRSHGMHAEAIEILFDPEQTSYRELLEFFFQVHDPTTLNRQGNDIGTSYRSAIFYLDEEQRRLAEETIADVDASGLWPGRVVTEVTPATYLLMRHFEPAEARRLAQLLSNGTWTHDHPLMAAELQHLGFPIRLGVPEDERELMDLYPQPRGREEAVEYVPGTPSVAPGREPSNRPRERTALFTRS